MTTKDYSHHQTAQKVIDQARDLLKKFSRNINLEYLESAKDLLTKAIENTPDGDNNKEMCLSELGNMYQNFPLLDEWLAGPRMDYLDEIFHHFEYWNEEGEELDRTVLITALNDTNKQREEALETFFSNHNDVFDKNFYYAKAGFEGLALYQGCYSSHQSDDWVSIFLNQYGWRKLRFEDDGPFRIENAPAFQTSIISKPYFPENNINLSDRNHPGNTQEYLIPFMIDGFPEEGIESTALCVISSNLINKISKLISLIKSGEINDLDIESFVYFADYIYLENDLHNGRIDEFYNISDEVYVSLPEDNPDEILIPEDDWVESDLDEFTKFDHGRDKLINCVIEISTDGLMNIKLLINPDDYDYEYWLENPYEFTLLHNLKVEEFLSNIT